MPFRALRSGEDMFAKWAARFAGFLEDSGDPKRAAEELAEIIEDDREFVQWFENAGLHAWMAGQLMVRGIELQDDESKPGAIALARDPGAFVSLPFEAAIEFFTSKQVMTPAQFDAVRGRFRKGAFTARNLTSQASRQLAFNATSAVIEGGTSVPQAVSALRAGELALGVESHYLANVVRTNAATSYNAGRFDAMTDPAVVALRPFWLYVTARDERVREEHAVLEGRMFEANSEEGLQYYPPLGYQCRCSMVTQSQRQFEARGGTLSGSDIPGAKVTQGFDTPPEPLK